MNMAELTRLGVSARADAEGKLILDAPAGVLTPNLLEELRQSKVALLAELAGNVNLVNMVNIVSSCTHSGKKTISPPPEVHALMKVGAGDTATASSWWLIHFRDRDPVEMACCPEATRAEILERHPDAIAAEPFTPIIRQPTAPMTAGEEQAIRAWLMLIEETDQEIIDDVVGQCQRDAEARSYYVGRAGAELPQPAQRKSPTCAGRSHP